MNKEEIKQKIIKKRQNVEMQKAESSEGKLFKYAMLTTIDEILSLFN